MRRRYPTTPSTGSATSLSVRTTRPSAPEPGRRSWPPCATPRSTSADWPATPTSPPPNATTAGHPAQPSKRSPQHDQPVSVQVRAIPDLAMPLVIRAAEPVVRPVRRAVAKDENAELLVHQPDRAAPATAPPTATIRGT